MPEKAEAIAYARSIGADLVLYLTWNDSDGYTEHEAHFYASKTVQRAQPVQDNMDIIYAEKELQATWDRLPTAKKNALRASQRAWILRKDGAPAPVKLALIKERIAYLAAQ